MDRWLGAVPNLQLEVDKFNYSAFVNVSAAQSWYRAIDYFD